MSLCDKCNGACCRWVRVMVGTRHAFESVEWMNLRGIYDARREGHWRVRSKCKHLKWSWLRWRWRCGVYENRHGACSSYEAGGATCLEVRALEGFTD